MKNAAAGKRRIRTAALIRPAAFITACVFILRGCINLGVPAELEKLLKRLGEDEGFIREVLSYELDASKWNAGPEPAPSDPPAAAVYSFAYFNPDKSDNNLSGEAGPQTLPTPAPAGGQGGDEQPDTVKALTLGASGSGMAFGDIYLNNQTSKKPDFHEIMEVPEIEADSDGAQVLIYHTHGSEAYSPADGDIYVPTDTYRTDDENYNVLRIGREVAAVLEENGIKCVHVTELHDYPSYTGSFERSLETAKAYLTEHPSIKVVLDIHRDAIENEEGETIKTAARTQDGTGCAQVLIIAGTDDSGLWHPYWEQNLAFGIRLQEALDKAYPTLARPLSLRPSRFNQHISGGSLLIEIGSAGNTLQEALECARRFALVLAELI